MRILDLTAGSRRIWWNKAHPQAIFVDVRPEVHPTIVADSRNLLETLGTRFHLVVFDPLHVNGSAHANRSNREGRYTAKEMREFIYAVGREAHRDVERISLPPRF